MAKGKEFPLSIVIRTVDNATAGLRRINDRLRKFTAPIRQLNSSLGSLGRAANLPQIASGFANVGREARGVALKIGAVAVAAGLSTAAIRSMISAGDNLAKRADRLGLTVDGYAQLRFAAGQAGVEIARFDSAMEGFAKRVGEAKANTGSLTTFLKKVSPALLKQVKSATSTEEAFGLLASAMTKLEDPTKRAALASAAFGRSGLVLLNLFAEGKEGIDELKREYFELAGSQEEAARESERVTDAFGRISAATSGAKAAIVTGLAPALLDISASMSAFFVDNRPRIAAFAKDFGEKLPGRIKAFVDAIKSIGRAVKPVIDLIGGLKGVVIALAVAITAKLIVAIGQLVVALIPLLAPLGIAIGLVLSLAAAIALKLTAAVIAFGVVLLANPVTLFIAGITAIIAAAIALTRGWSGVGNFFGALWDGIKFVFQAAWDFIKMIVDKIVGAVKRVVGAAKKVAGIVKGGAVGAFDFVTGREELGIGSLVPAAPSVTEARVSVDFANAPPGTRVSTDPGSTADVDLSLGMQLELEP